MANNRLYIIDDETGETFTLAKSSGTGWHVWQDADEFVKALDEFFAMRDMGASFRNSGEAEPTRLRLVTEEELPPEQ